MSNQYFRFKQFTVRHDLCAMKVGTDGVLLGAWAECFGTKNILDVGTGSGLIALMLAQRQQDARIVALDIDENACRQATLNFQDTVFKNRLSVVQTDYHAFTTEETFDLIVSKPPYFSSSLKSPDALRNAARHNDSLPPATLICKSLSLMSDKSRLAVILPFDNYETFHSIALANRLFPYRKTTVFSLPDKPPKRILLEYANHPTEFRENNLIIEMEPKQFGEEFKKMVSEFYLDKA